MIYYSWIYFWFNGIAFSLILFIIDKNMQSLFFACIYLYLLKCTVNLISSEPPLVRFTRVPCLIKYKLDILVHVSVIQMKCIFICGFSAKVTCFVNNWEIIRNKTFSSNKRRYFHIQGYRCKSGMSFFFFLFAEGSSDITPTVHLTKKT